MESNGGQPRVADAVTGEAAVASALVDPFGDSFVVSDHLDIEVVRGGQSLVVSDLHLGATATTSSMEAADGLADILDSWTKPGVLVIAGDGFEMLAGPADMEGILGAHQRLTTSVKDWNAKRNHRVAVIPGNHDGQLAWDPVPARILHELLGPVDMALAIDLNLDTGDGLQRVRVIHGNQFDPYNSFVDPRSPVDTPFGHHVVRDVLPELESRQRGDSPLAGIQWLSGDLTDFVGSRLLYRTLVGRLWWLVVPFAAALLLRCLAFLPGASTLVHDHAERWAIGFGIVMVFLILTAAIAALATMLRVNGALREAGTAQRSSVATHNAAPRAEALRLIASGYAGMVSGHTHEPELAIVGVGFYANSGCGVGLVVPRRSRLNLPRPYVAIRRLSYLRLEAGPVLEVELSMREIPTEPPKFLERLALAKDRSNLRDIHVVAALPGGTTWPIDEQTLSPWLRRRQVRRMASAVLVLAGVLNIVFAFLWPVKATRAVDYWLPFGIHPISGVAAVVGGLALCGISRGVLRGYRRSWIAALVVLTVSSVDRLAHSRGVSGSIIAFLIALWLVAQHSHFEVSPPGWRRRAGFVVTGGLIVLALATGLDRWFQVGHRTGRDVIAGAVIAAGVLVAVTALPGAERRRRGPAREEASLRARAIIERYGGDTLDYFALRDDKSWLFSGDTLIAYSVINRVMLVSPDPIGPAEKRADAWTDAMELANANGWAIAVLAAGESWLPIYRAAGLIDIYMGDEATVDCQTFALSGKSMKSLRGAYNRVKKAGCRVELMDPLNAPEELRRQLLALMEETRQGDDERGYSMTLSRMFEARDTGLLLAVCFGPDGQPLAFNQYVPASLIFGYSLDVMRRTADPDAPNGLTDFVIIETIDWMAKRGMQGLGLNFATLREVVAAEDTKGPWRSLGRTVLHHFSESMQIESLWRFNKKYDPEWRPRYAVTDSLLRVPRTGMAIARAESVSEIPVFGKLLKTKPPRLAPDDAPVGR